MSATGPSPNELWRELFLRMYNTHGTKSIRTFQIANIAADVGFPVERHPEEGYWTGDNDIENALNKSPNRDKLNSLSAFGTLLKRKHNHVHGGFRLINDRIELGWSKKTSRTTFHVEPKDEPRSVARSIAGLQHLDGESEE